MNLPLETMISPPIMAMLRLACLVAARLLPIVAFTPLFGGQALPARFRFGTTIAFTLAFAPMLQERSPGGVAETLFFLLLVKEAVIGLTLAVGILVVFEAVAAGAALIDISRGGVLAMLSDPQHHQQPALSMFGVRLAVVLFLTVGGHRALFAALADSFVAAPIDQMMPPHLVSPAATTAIIHWTGRLLIVALQMAAPVLIVVLVVDAALGMIGRTAPQLDAHFIGLGIKSLLVFVVMMLTLPMMMHLFCGQWEDAWTMIRHWMHS